MLKISSKNLKKANFEEIDLREKSFEKEKLEKKVKFLAKSLVKKLREKKLKITTMESCLGGALINEITNIPHASEITDGALITYSVAQKIKRGVPKKIIEKFGVYSKETALSMALAVKKEIKSEIAIGVTGVLSRKDPKAPSKKIGEVYIGFVLKNNLFSKKLLLPVLKERALEKKVVVLKILEVLNKVL